MWKNGRVVVNGTLYFYEAKVYKEGSTFGINQGRVSKLIVWKPSARALNAIESNNPYYYTSRSILDYDRGWVTNEPKEGTFEHELLQTVLAAIEISKENEKK